MDEVIKDSFCSYPKLWALGHYAIENIFDGEVYVEEKVDGSQFSFGFIRGELKCRSKSVALNMFAPEKMFVPAIESVKAIHEATPLIPEFTYRGEYLARPKHNVNAYDRTPEKLIIGFDISNGHESLLSYEEKLAEFKRIGLEHVPLLKKGVIEDPQELRSLLETKSILGGQLVEGVVVKNYNKITKLGQIMMGKFVSEAFKEVHNTEWKENTNAGLIEQIITEYRTPARWHKAVQHLAERGELKSEPSDIGSLFKEVNYDVLEECGEEIKGKLFKQAWPSISRGITRGLPQWYKEELLKKAFNSEEVQ